MMAMRNLVWDTRILGRLPSTLKQPDGLGGVGVRIKPVDYSGPFWPYAEPTPFSLGSSVEKKKQEMITDHLK